MNITGSIGIKAVYGKMGAFNVGVLSTSIGDFAVKSEMLDQFEEGQYDVNAIISQIYLGGFTWGGTKRVIELRASIEHIETREIVSDTPSNVAPPQEIDPELQETSNNDSKAIETPSDEDIANKVEKSAEEILGKDLLAMFTQKVPFNLDPTVGRAKVREQSNFLKENHYRFFPKDRLWKFKE